MSVALQKLIERSQSHAEDWRYTDLPKLLAADKKAARPANQPTPSLPKMLDEQQKITFVNGVLQPEQSRFGNLPSSVIQGDGASGYILNLAAQSCLVTTPIELVHVQDKADTGATRLTIAIGANASATIIEHYLASPGTTQILETGIHLAPQAKLIHKHIAHDLRDAAHFMRLSVRVDAGAYYRSFALIKDTRLLRNEVDVVLAGELAQCALFGALLLQGREHADLQTRIHHEAPHGSSNQLFKAVLKDQSRGVFQGRIKVAEGAQKTDGKQLCRALLLSDQAEMDAKPELEIYADDVACAHGCAIGDLDKDAMFYLRSRGLDENQARALLLRAFIDEAIDEVQAEDARAYLRALAGEWMNE